MEIGLQRHYSKRRLQFDFSLLFYHESIKKTDGTFLLKYENMKR